MVRARLHQMNLFFDRKFDVEPPEETYDLKLGFTSSHTMAIDAARSGAQCWMSAADAGMSGPSW